MNVLRYLPAPWNLVCRWYFRRLILKRTLVGRLWAPPPSHWGSHYLGFHFLGTGAGRGQSTQTREILLFPQA